MSAEIGIEDESQTENERRWKRNMINDEESVFRTYKSECFYDVL